MTNLTEEQFQTVVREMAANDADEAWRILQMFACGIFNRRLTDFPVALQELARTPRRKDYRALLEMIRHAPPVFTCETIGTAHGHELVRLVTRTDSASGSICIVAGIHGDEPDGILGALEFACRFAASADMVRTYDLVIYPCVNPTGYEAMTRANAAGKDLNREFFRDSGQPEVQIMERELRAQQFTGFISGHSDYESFGIYAYATGAVLSERLAKPALFQASGIIPINTDPVIDGHPAQFGIINAKFPGSLGPLTKGTSEPFDITIETPNLFALTKRVEAQAAAFETILQEYRAVMAEAMYL